MKWFASRMLWAVVLTCVLLPAALWAQSDVVQAGKTEQKREQQDQKAGKKPHVWTDDDLPKATDSTVSTAAVSQGTSAAPEAKTGEAAGAPADAQANAPAQPAMDVKTAEDKVKKAQEVVDNTKSTIAKLQEMAASETGNRQQADLDMLQHAQNQLPGYEATLTQAQKNLAAAQQQGQAGGQGGQAGAPPPASAPQGPPQD